MTTFAQHIKEAVETKPISKPRVPGRDWCGPAIMSAVLGSSVEHAAGEYQKVRGDDHPVGEVYDHETVGVLKNNGFKVKSMQPNSPMTLQQVLPHLHPTKTHLISMHGHTVLAKAGKVYDGVTERFHGHQDFVPVEKYHLKDFNVAYIHQLDHKGFTGIKEPKEGELRSVTMADHADFEPIMRHIMSARV